MKLHRDVGSWALLLTGALMVGGVGAAGCNCSGDESTQVTPTTGTGGHAATGGGGTSGTQGGGGGLLFGGSGGIHQGGGNGAGGAGASDPCGDGNPTCTVNCVGPTCEPPVTFPLPTDDPAPGNVTADGVDRDADGYLVLDSESTQFDYLWVADDMAYGVGLISKISTTEFAEAPYYREVARYPSVTCFSDPVRGSKEGAVLGLPTPAGLCADGLHGCCSRSETQPGPNGGHRPVQTLFNRPSRTAVDTNGDMWVANRAHHFYSGDPNAPYAQTSVTKVANNEKDCIDRNGNGLIDTSRDLNNDGIITTDCNDDDLPDDGATVCTQGMSHEFYGLDDECILFTVDLDYNGVGRPMALGPGDGGPTDPSDAWAGMWATGKFYRIDGKTGGIKTSVQLQVTNPNGSPINPYGAAVDQYGILWSPQCCGLGTVSYFDTNDPQQQGVVTYAGPSASHYGIAIDGLKEVDPDTGNEVLVQQIWFGELSTNGACRYRPVRNQGFAALANGDWACAYFSGGVCQGRGIAVDNRQPTSYAWVALDGYGGGAGCPGYSPAAMGRIPTNIPANQSTALATTDTFSSLTEFGMTGAGVSFDGDVWGVDQDSNNSGTIGTAGSVVHYTIDEQGNLVGSPDVIPLDDKPGHPDNFCQANSGSGQCKPHPYTYSDFTGFGLRNFVVPHGFYSWIESPTCGVGKATFLRVEWDAETPDGTAITMMARSANDLAQLESAFWTGRYDASPAVLSQAPGPLAPNPATYLEVLFELTTTGDATPRLKSFHVIYECETDVPH